MAEKAADRLVRLMGLVAHLDAHGQASVEELAARFGISSQQVLADVDTLWLSGTPGYQPEDLIDFDAFSLEQGVVRLTQSRGMTRPLRLGGREAIGLMTAVRALVSALGPALDDERRTLLQTALTKLQAAAGTFADLDDAAMDVELSLPPAVTGQITTALTAGQRLRLRYVNAADQVSWREVDPLRLVADPVHTYLLAWCHTADGERMFRLDRVLEVQQLSVPVESHQLSPRSEVFVPQGESVTLHLRSPARWIAETAPVRNVRNLDDGSFVVELKVVSPAWLTGLLLTVAAQVVSVHPLSVAQSVSAQAQAALDAYEALT